MIFLLSLLICTGFLYAGNTLLDNVVRQRMVRYATASARETDGAPNLVVLNGEEGLVADTNIQIKYMKDGYIRIIGTNPYGKSIWKKLSDRKLQQGTYTLTGLKGMKKKSIELQLSVETDTENMKYYCQYDENVTFSIDKDRMTFLYIRVYPYAEIDTNARPAIYKEKDELFER